MKRLIKTLLRENLNNLDILNKEYNKLMKLYKKVSKEFEIADLNSDPIAYSLSQKLDDIVAKLGEVSAKMENL